MPSEFETVITDQTEYGTMITTQGAAIIADCILNGKKLPIVEVAAGAAGAKPQRPPPARPPSSTSGGGERSPGSRSVPPPPT